MSRKLLETLEWEWIVPISGHSNPSIQQVHERSKLLQYLIAQLPPCDDVLERVMGYIKIYYAAASTDNEDESTSLSCNPFALDEPHWLSGEGGIVHFRRLFLWLTTRVLLYAMASSSSPCPSLSPFTRTQGGAVETQAHDPFHIYSLTHSLFAAGLLRTVSSTDHTDIGGSRLCIGIDVSETLGWMALKEADERNGGSLDAKGYRRMFRFPFTNTEWTALEKMCDGGGNFLRETLLYYLQWFRLWTVKESVVKALWRDGALPGRPPANVESFSDIHISPLLLSIGTVSVGYYCTSDSNHQLFALLSSCSLEDSLHWHPITVEWHTRRNDECTEKMVFENAFSTTVLLIPLSSPCAIDIKPSSFRLEGVAEARWKGKWEERDIYSLTPEELEAAVVLSMVAISV